MEAAALRKRLAAWFAENGRDLPWRRTTDPYAIIVSEFMLQQTTVAAVVPYFERWMTRFPRVSDLAAADEQEVLHLWQGLGYYSRARNLHKAAKVIVAECEGVLPRELEDRRKLPGVGEYTAAAVGAFAFDDSVPVVDANIARVLARLFDYRETINSGAGVQFLKEAAEGLFPAKGGRLHTSALMELGALVCVSRSPKCFICPVKTLCKCPDPENLPKKQSKKDTEFLMEKRAFILERDKVWLMPSSGPRWKGLWLMPESAGAPRPAEHVEIYPITRYRITMHVFEEKCREGLSEFSVDKLPPMPSPHRRAVEAMLKKGR